jgi:hypothetical protein
LLRGDSCGWLDHSVKERSLRDSQKFSDSSDPKLRTGKTGHESPRESKVEEFYISHHGDVTKDCG